MNPIGNVDATASMIKNAIDRPAEDREKLAADFESVFVSLLVSNMRKSSFGEGLFPGDKSDTLGGLFDMMISGQIAKTGGIGLQDLVRNNIPQAGSDALPDNLRNLNALAATAASVTRIPEE